MIRGSAVNQSGASAGLTVPNGPAQERVIEEALARAGIAPSDVDYLETHGTGSAMGDPIEVRAAAAVYGKGRAPERPLLIGSFKPNIGHPEAAAGIAGLIKVTLAMQEKLIPPQPDFRTPSPLVDWDKLPVKVTSQPTPWPLALRPTAPCRYQRVRNLRSKRARGGRGLRQLRRLRPGHECARWSRTAGSLRCAEVGRRGG